MRSVSEVMAGSRPGIGRTTSLTSCAGLASEDVLTLFRTLGHLYGHRWTASLPTSEAELAEMLATWAQGLGGLSAEELRRGLAELVRREDPWPPSLPELRSLCRSRAAACHQPYLALPRPPRDRVGGLASLAALRERLSGRTDPGSGASSSGDGQARLGVGDDAAGGA